MRIDGRELKTVDAPNVHSCSPTRVVTALRYCFAHLPSQFSEGEGRKLVAYDPLCGNGVIPTVLRAHFSDRVGHILASDAYRPAVQTTDNNLALFDRSSAAPAITFRHNIAHPFPDFIANGSIDLAHTDIPYGEGCKWVDDENKLQPSAKAHGVFLRRLFEHLDPKMAAEGVIGVIAGCRTKMQEQYGLFECVQKYEIPGHGERDGRVLYVMKRA